MSSRRRFHGAPSVLALAVLAAACAGAPEPAPAPAQHAVRSSPVTAEVPGGIRPLPRALGLDPGKVRLGERLFHDPRLSGDGTVSCSSCHELALGGTDRKRFSVGVAGAVGTVNSPTVFNVGFHFKQFWDGRVDTLEEQVDGPLLNPAEMATTWEAVLAMVKGDPEYRAEFAELYPLGPDEDAVRDAIATFERSLVTHDAPFDRFLRGEAGALSPDAERGFELFVQRGCVTCHQGVGIGGNQFARFGLMADYFEERGNVTEADYGRFNVTGDEADRYTFKVPSLRNVALTPPYFHDGSVWKLEDAVRTMARVQLGRRLPDEEVSALVAFLRSLTGEYRGQPLAGP